MSGEAACPTCGGAAEPMVVYDAFIPNAVITGGYRSRVAWRSAAADPSQVQAMRELLREMYESWLRLVGPNDQKQWRDWKARIIPLLEGTFG